MLTPAVLGQSGKGANRSLFFGAGNGPAQTAKNRSGCLFRSPFLWSLSFGGAKESDRKIPLAITAFIMQVRRKKKKDPKFAAEK